MKDGVIVAAAEEERFTREKHAPDAFPEQSIRYCLEEAGITEQEVTHVVYARLKPIPTAFVVFWYYVTHPPRTILAARYAFAHIKVQLRGVLKELMGSAGYQRLHRHFKDLPKKIWSFNHHQCHAASTFLLSPFEEAVVVTWDGKGEATSLTISEGKGATLTLGERRGIYESLGLWFSGVTQFLGFTPNDGEYKVMGLAPYGKPGLDFSPMIVPDESRGFLMHPDFALYPTSQSAFEKLLGEPRAREAPFTEHYQDIGRAAQDTLEAAGLSFIRYAKRLVPSENLCLAGGVALNVKLNKVIWESGLFKNIFVQPVAGDNGLPLGAGALLYTKLTGKRPAPLSHLYLGPAFSDDAVEAAFKSAGVVYTKSMAVEEETASLLASGNVIGWFQGRMEFGPRALGSRSILAHPSFPDMKEIINAKIKFRESFRPFCPSILEEKVAQFCEKYTPAPYMVLSFSVPEREAGKIAATVHVDGTVRPQAVTKRTNVRYHKLIEAFERKTGIPALLNTSMNIRGEPIVCTPEDLLNFFKKTNVDAVVAGPFIVRREAQIPAFFETLSREELKTQY